jgi:tetratricopeptide (TPR) repeat protein
MRIAAAVLCGLPVVALGQTPEGPPVAEAKNSASWWIGTYGAMDGSHPLARRAQDVFRRVAAAADKRGSRLPKLVLLRRPGGPQGFALPDGSVVVTRAALELCYANGLDANGDAKLAFVLGHELSHLATDDFWKGRASFETSAGDSPRLSEHERKADDHGIVYAALAGYDPRAVFAGPFLAEWVQPPRAEVRPKPGQAEKARLEQLRADLLAVAEELDVFSFGVRLLQLGRHNDALFLLQRFRTRFPGREVHNNIGLAHLQLALRFLAACDKTQYLRFKLPLMVDPETLGASTSFPAPIPHVRGMASPALSCTSLPGFQKEWGEAVQSFQVARERDPTYLLAYVNLATALLVAGNGTEALNEANSALKLDPASRPALLQRAVALFLMGSENDVDTVGPAIEALRKLQQTDATSADATYDLARILTELDRSAAASQAWKRFLDIERTGSYAAEAARSLPDPPAAAPAPRPKTALLPVSPLRLGSLASTAGASATSVREIREGSFRGSILRNGDFRALAIDDVVEVVERPTRIVTSPEESYGTPQRKENGRKGDLYFYPGLMVEWSPGHPRTEVFFQAASRPSAQR